MRSIYDRDSQINGGIGRLRVQRWAPGSIEPCGCQGCLGARSEYGRMYKESLRRSKRFAQYRAER